MRIRLIEIVKDGDLTDVEALPTHPNIVKCWRLPRGFTLYEWYHPFFERTHDSDPAVSNAAKAEPGVRPQMIALNAEKRRLLSPLYEEVEFPEKGAFCLFADTATYMMFGRGKNSFRWLAIGRSNGWAEARRMRVAGRMSITPPGKPVVLEEVFREWADCMTSLDVLKRWEALSFRGTHFSSECEFSEPAGDALVALYMLLTATRYVTSARAVGFFHPSDYSSPYLNVGVPGKISQEEP